VGAPLVVWRCNVPFRTTHRVNAVPPPAVLSTYPRMAGSPCERSSTASRQKDFSSLLVLHLRMLRAGTLAIWFRAFFEAAERSAA
jgi:hypothetical protein